MSEVDKSVATPSSTQRRCCDPILLDMASASAVDLRRTSRPTAADAIVALVEAYTRLRASHTELFGIFDGLIANVPEEFEVIERARVIAATALCSDCPPAGYPTDATRCNPCPRRKQP